ncbi:MAG: dienelactone hydrolase family protein [Beijerinckiaceae bacterium]|nr:dienelactone hydrolase family protein [Beijerinckiaceae bacterium]MCZ8299009.1 dienelactone hydrolase family protein [Beijerinckiaceae bacterium]
MLNQTDADSLVSRFPLKRTGAPPTRAAGFVLMLHGRGASAESILELAEAFAQPDLCFLAPQAPGYSWYPYPFIAPLAANEPPLSSALTLTAGVLDALEHGGIPAARTGICGFSQGACLALETAIRQPRAYGAVFGFSGGYIGPMGEPRRPVPGTETALAGASVLIGCSDVDSHIPLSRVQETTALMRAMGAEVDERIYPGFGHGINADELGAARARLQAMQE